MRKVVLYRHLTGGAKGGLAAPALLVLVDGLAGSELDFCAFRRLCTCGGAVEVFRHVSKSRTSR